MTELLQLAGLIAICITIGEIKIRNVKRQIKRTHESQLNYSTSITGNSQN